MKKEPLILAIESSCDDTGAAVLQGRKVLSNVVAGQSVHEKYGGIVPELASRSHQQNIVPVVHQALEKAGIKKEELDAVAFTKGPGLLGSLLVGSSFAKAFSLALNKPLIEINHMEAHILAHFIEGDANPEFPFICLTVSGGHTQLVKVTAPDQFHIMGETIDDAAGEAFDKIAKIMDFPFPGGPMIDKLSKEGDANKFTFPHPKVSGLDFSFSGLKTSVLYFLKKEIAKNPDFIKENKKDLAASVQKTIIDILMKQLRKAADENKITQIAIAGGVSANSGLRTAIKSESGWTTYIPKFEYCTDNAAMIGIAAYYKFMKGEFTDQTSKASARLVM
ncbi:MAG: tRNA (adenosine(37)-N6)-threonylcarbamoyltransferase complex transferase subunit TsaD [Flavobacteriales bacterium]